MALAGRNSNSLRNGRCSRGSSPNGHASESSSEDEAEKIRVGRDFQAVIPKFIPVRGRRLEQCPDKALPVWSPTVDIPDAKLDEYLALAKEKYGYNSAQALGMLFWHKYDLEKAIWDLANFTPFRADIEDKDHVFILPFAPKSLFRLSLNAICKYSQLLEPEFSVLPVHLQSAIKVRLSNPS